MSLSAVRLFLLLWTSTSRNHGTHPQRRRRATDDHAAIDSPIDFVEMPNRMGLGSAFAQVRRDLGSKLAQPAPDGLVVLLSQKVAGHLR